MSELSQKEIDDILKGIGEFKNLEFLTHLKEIDSELYLIRRALEKIAATMRREPEELE